MEQLGDIIVSETTRTIQKTTNEIENQNFDPERIAKESLKEMEHLTRQSIKLTEKAADKVSKGINSITERTKEWDVNL